jgi:hypothetical protein
MIVHGFELHARPIASRANLGPGGGGCPSAGRSRHHGEARSKPAHFGVDMHGYIEKQQMQEEVIKLPIPGKGWLRLGG